MMIKKKCAVLCRKTRGYIESHHPLLFERLKRGAIAMLRALAVVYMTRKRLIDKCYEGYFRYLHRGTPGSVKIVLVDWAEYPLRRTKRIGDIRIKCGIGSILEKIDKHLAGIEFHVVLVINETKDDQDRLYLNLKKKYPFIERVLFRDNTGMDFGAYDCGYQYLKDTGYDGDVLFINSSVRGPDYDFWLMKYAFLFHRRGNMGACGIMMNSHTTHLENRLRFMPHVQSYFMYTAMSVLRRTFVDHLPGALVSSTDQRDIVSQGETRFSEEILDGGYGICCDSPKTFTYYKDGPWRYPLFDNRYSYRYSRLANTI